MKNVRIYFGHRPQPHVVGELHGGTAVWVVYVATRIAAQPRSVELYYSFPPRPSCGKIIVECPQSGVVEVPLSIVPHARMVALWFKVHSDDGAVWDSDYGRNFSFPVYGDLITFVEPHWPLLEGQRRGDVVYLDRHSVAADEAGAPEPPDCAHRASWVIVVRPSVGANMALKRVGVELWRNNRSEWESLAGCFCTDEGRRIRRMEDCASMARCMHEQKSVRAPHGVRNLVSRWLRQHIL
jgi:hypothetical protein